MVPEFNDISNSYDADSFTISFIGVDSVWTLHQFDSEFWPSDALGVVCLDSVQGRLSALDDLKRFLKHSVFLFGVHGTVGCLDGDFFLVYFVWSTIFARYDYTCRLLVQTYSHPHWQVITRWRRLELIHSAGSRYPVPQNVVCQRIPP